MTDLESPGKVIHRINKKTTYHILKASELVKLLKDDEILTKSETKGTREEIVKRFHNHFDEFRESIISEPIILAFYRQKYYIISGRFMILALKDITGENHDILPEKEQNASSKAKSEPSRQSHEESVGGYHDPNIMTIITNFSNYREMKKYYVYYASVINDHSQWGYSEDSGDLSEEEMDKTINHFAEKYPNFFKTSQNPRPPNVNIRLFRDMILNSGIINKLGISSSEELIKALEELNTKIGNRFKGKSDKYNDCLDRGGLFMRINNEAMGMVVATKIKRKDVKSKPGVNMKYLVWVNYMGKVFEAPCFCCEKFMIDLEHCELGHVESDKDGGATTVDNLRPICSTCNRSMGATNMIKYMRDNGLNWKKMYVTRSESFIKDGTTPESSPTLKTSSGTGIKVRGTPSRQELKQIARKLFTETDETTSAQTSASTLAPANKSPLRSSREIAESSSKTEREISKINLPEDDGSNPESEFVVVSSLVSNAKASNKSPNLSSISTPRINGSSETEVSKSSSQSETQTSESKSKHRPRDPHHVSPIYRGLASLFGRMVGMK
jgi:hypothetical protein